jgi:hypothetical protein
MQDHVLAFVCSFQDLECKLRRRNWISSFLEGLIQILVLAFVCSFLDLEQKFHCSSITSHSATSPRNHRRDVRTEFLFCPILFTSHSSSPSEDSSKTPLALLGPKRPTGRPFTGIVDCSTLLLDDTISLVNFSYISHGRLWHKIWWSNRAPSVLHPGQDDDQAIEVLYPLQGCRRKVP